MIHWCGTLILYACLRFLFAFCPFQNLTALGYHLGSLPVDVRSVCSAVFYHVECATVLSLHPTPYPRKTVQSWKLHTCVSYCPLQIHCSTCWPGQLAFIHISVTDLGFAVSCIQQNWRKEDCVICMLPTERSAYTASTNSWARHIILFYFYNPIITHRYPKNYWNLFLEAQHHSAVNSTHSSKNRMLCKKPGSCFGC